MQKNTNKRKLLGIGAILCGAVLLSFVAFQFTPLHFNHALWMSRRDKRFKMEADLMSHYLKPGMTRDEVRQLIGPQDYVESDSHKFQDFLDSDSRYGLTLAETKKTKFILYYDLGYGYGFGDPIAMCLQFDNADKLARTWQMGH